MPCRVVKVGGSLLETPTLPYYLAVWLRSQNPSATLLVVGGGVLADGVRQLDRRCGIQRQAAHWQAIRAMTVNGLILQQLVTGLALVERVADWPPRPPDGKPIVGLLDTEWFLRHEEPRLPGARLPASWRVTSDSIAARVAEAVGADELVLLKSTLPDPPGDSIDLPAAVAQKYVDDHFPVSARTARIRAVNLRDPAFPEVTLEFARSSRSRRV